MKMISPAISSSKGLGGGFIPAIAEQGEEYLINTSAGAYHFTRSVGDILHPERESRETLASIRQTMGEYHFMSQYQQTLCPRKGSS